MNDQNSSDNVNQSQRNEAMPPDLYAARMTGSRETIIKLVLEFKLDVGCQLCMAHAGRMMPLHP